jgi:putative ABC transport system permease protein
MLRLSKIALKNVFRNKRRTLITFSVILFGATALLVAGGFIRFMFDGLAQSSINNGLGHLQIHNPDHLIREEEQPLQYGLSGYHSIARIAAGIPGVRGAAARIDFMGLLSNGEKSTIFLGTGLEPDKERKLGYTTELISGSGLESTARKFQTLLAIGLANTLNAKVGDTLTLMSTTTDGALNAVDAEVAGIFTTGFAEYDERALRVPLPVAQKLLDNDRQVSKLIVGLDRTRDTDRIHDRLQARLRQAGYTVATKRWYELATYYQQVVRMFSAVFALLGAIIFVLVVLSSSNTMLMSVFERVREIGTLMAFGTTRWKIVGIFLTEGALIGLFGGMLGTATGYLAIVLMNHAHLTMPTPPGSTHGWPIVMPVVPLLFVAVFLLMILTMVTASVLPALRASRLNIVEALNHI